MSMGLSSDTNLIDFSVIVAGGKLLLFLERFEMKLQKSRVNRNYFVNKKCKARRNYDSP